MVKVLSGFSTIKINKTLDVANTAVVTLSNQKAVNEQVIASNGSAVYWVNSYAVSVNSVPVSTIQSGNGLTQYVNTTAAYIYVLANTGIVANSTGLFVNSAFINAVSANSATYIPANSGIVSNSSGVFVNTSYIATLSANNTDYLDGQHGTYYTNATNITTGTLPYAQLGSAVVNTSGNFTLSGNTTLAGTTTTISSNLNVTGTYLNVASAFVANSSGAYHTGGVFSAVRYGVPTQYFEIRDNDSSGPIVTSYSDVTNAKPITFNSTTIANNQTANGGNTGILFQTYGSTRVYIDPVGNVGIGNTTPADKIAVSGSSYLGGIVTATSNVNVTNYVNAAVHSVGTAFTANATVVNAVSYYAGSTLIGNTIGPYGKTEGNLNVNSALTSNNSTNLGTYGRDYFVYGDSSATGSFNTYTVEGGVGANNITRSMFYRDNRGQFGALGIHVQHPTNSGYAGQLAWATYDGTLQYRMKYAGTWGSNVTILDSTNYNSYAPTLTGTGASGTWNITANNATYAYGKTEGNLNVNSALTSNSSSYIGTLPAANVVSNAQLSANLANYAALAGATFTGAVAVSNNLTVTGNLIVTGTTVSMNVTTLDVKDLNITLAKGAATNAATDGAGITIDTANIGWYYNYASNTWQSNVGHTPASNNNLDLGSTTLRWGSVYANNVTVTNLSGNGSSVTSVNAVALGGKTEGNLNVNSAIYANSSSTNTFTVGTASYFVANGNLGIGTASPSYKLDINGNFRSDGPRPLVYNSGLGSLTLKGDVGGWAMGMYAQGSSGTDKGGFGFSGAADTLGYYWIGSAYNSATAYFLPGGNVGIGVSSPGAKLDTAGSIRGQGLTVTSSSIVAGANQTTVDYLSSVSRIIAWGANTSTKGALSLVGASSDASVYTDHIRIDTSGNIGIGLTNPSYLVHGYSTSANLARFLMQGTTNFVLSQLNNTSGNFYIGIDSSTASGFGQGNYSRIIYSDGAYPMVFTTNSTERMRIDASGNMGLGVTPQTWGSNFKAIEIAGVSSGVVSAYVNNLNFGTNFRNDNTNWLYTYTGQNSTRYEMHNSGQHRWYIAPSGTAGANIAFTQAMTLAANGNLGINTTSPIAKLTIDAGGTMGVGSGIYVKDGDITSARSSSTGAIYFGTDNSNKYLYHDGSNYLFGSVGYVYTGNSFRAPIFYDYDNTSYYVDPATTTNINSLIVGSSIKRSAAGTGYLDGQYSSVETSSKTGPIYSIGGSYYPTATSLNTMYGVGYTHTDSGVLPSGSFGWGFYVATAGTAYAFIGNALSIFSGSARSPIFYDLDNTAYYVDPASTSSLNAATFVGGVTHNVAFMNRVNNTSTGINWYTPSYTAWQDYMAPAGANQGYTGTVTAPAGTYVTTWARRSFIENTAGYGWTWEAGTATSTTPSIVAELSSATGNFRITGGLYATTKSFVIDHPSKPNMKLRYGSLEGPEHGVYIRGRLTNDHHIQFPDYWKDLVDIDTVTVQLTPIGKSKQPSVGDITDAGVNVLGKNIDCFYFIQAERKDVEKLVVEF